MLVVVVYPVTYGGGGTGQKGTTGLKAGSSAFPKGDFLRDNPELLAAVVSPEPLLLPPDFYPDGRPLDSSSLDILVSSTIQDLLTKKSAHDISAAILEKINTENNKKIIRESDLDLMGRVYIADALIIDSGETGSVNFYRINDAEPQINSASALISDLRGGKNYWGFSFGKKWPLASITKLMSAAVVMRDFDLNQPITIGAADFSVDEGEKNIRPGDRYSASDMLRTMLISSSNVTAEALASSYGRANFIAAMNNLAVEWGLADTHFSDPTGLSVSDQSTAEDIKKMAVKIYDLYPEIFRITRQPSVIITNLDTRMRKKISSINEFAGRSDFIGGKTGYTDEASGNLVSIFNYKKGYNVIVVVLGTEDRFGQTDKLISWFKNSFRLALTR